jgi:high-affinity nickel-transport protein
MVAAVLVGATEALGLVGDKFGFESGSWVTADATGARFGALGCLVVAVFAAIWLVSFVIHRAMGYDKIPTLDHL